MIENRTSILEGRWTEEVCRRFCTPQEYIESNIQGISIELKLTQSTILYFALGRRAVYMQKDSCTI